MTTGSWNRSSGYVTDTGSWNGTNDLPLKRKINPYTKVVTYNNNPPALLFYKNGGTYYSVRPTAVSDTWNGAMEANLDSRLRNATTNAIKGHSFNLGVTLGEARESLTMIAQSARGVAKLLRNPVAAISNVLRKGGSADDALSEASNVWLGMRYGWMPLVNDAYNAGTAAAAIMAAQTRTVFVSVAGEAPILVSGGFPAGGGWTSPGRSRHRKSVSLKITETPSLADSLGLTDPELVAWELIPFSFVVDWFLPVGSWLEARAVLGSTASTDCYYTSKAVVKFSGVTATGGWTGRHPIRYSRMTFSRTATSSLAALTSQKPQFRDWTDVFKGDIGVQRVVDSLALLKQTLFR